MTIFKSPKYVRLVGAEIVERCATSKSMRIKVRQSQRRSPDVHFFPASQVFEKPDWIYIPEWLFNKINDWPGKHGTLGIKFDYGMCEVEK